ncbi:MAG TPA: hypothetical protein VJB06_02845 [archaeon]|nr:hypothetical protein [archaeon]
MKIRKANPEDAEAISRLHRWTIRKINSKDYSKRQIYVWSKRSTPERLRKIMDNSKIFFYVAEDSNKIVAFSDFSLNV